MQIIPVRTRLFREGENLREFIVESIPVLQAGDILVVTSKIVALAEHRVIASNRNKRQVILEEAEESVETPWCLLTRNGNDWCANAGVDESNANGSVILLPKDPKESAKRLRDEFGNREIGLILTDTRTVPLRQGTMGMALAWAGVGQLKDYIGTPDLYGRPLKMTKANIVHALAAAAVLVMGEGAESVPIVIIRDSGVPINFEASGEVGDVAMLPEEDLYQYLFVAKSASRVDNTPIL